MGGLFKVVKATQKSDSVWSRRLAVLTIGCLRSPVEESLRDAETESATQRCVEKHEGACPKKYFYGGRCTRPRSLAVLPGNYLQLVIAVPRPPNLIWIAKGSVDVDRHVGAVPAVKHEHVLGAPAFQGVSRRSGDSGAARH